MLQLLRGTFPDDGMEQRQMDRQIRIFVDYIHEYLTDTQCDAQFLLTLPNERLLFSFLLVLPCPLQTPTEALGLYGPGAGRS